MKSKVFDIIQKEFDRQDETIELIASENFVSDNVMKAVGSCLTNKYSEGYPHDRYYGGCKYVDELEEYCKQKWLEVFNCEEDYAVNVQPHSGSNANLASFMAVLKQGDTVLSLDLNSGGHLTHGSKVNFSGKLYNFVHYGLDKDGYIDYNDLDRCLWDNRPKLVLAGASAYSREIDFQKIYNIINRYRETTGNTIYFMVDMSHIAGLVACGEHQSPFGLADIITTTTHKTLRGTRGGLIFCRKELEKKINSAVFPCTQGGALQHIIAGKAVTAEEALTKEYKRYIHNVVVNAKAMADEFIKHGYNVVTGGTDNHMFLLDLTNTGLTGKEVQDRLDKFGITVNKNCVPNETRSPKETSGIRIGTPAMTTKGFTEERFRQTARIMIRLIEEMQHEHESI